jgi:hypothetical protein
VKALDEIGWGRAFRFGWTTLAMLPYRAALVPQLRAPWLRLLGARIGRRTVVHGVRFFNPTAGACPGWTSATSVSWATSACSTWPRASAWRRRSRWPSACWC